jgi:DNA-binding PadR family transcriptional regulator
VPSSGRWRVNRASGRQKIYAITESGDDDINKTWPWAESIRSDRASPKPEGLKSGRKSQDVSGMTSQARFRVIEAVDIRTCAGLSK